ncbi:ABC transporter six-transmembrane domain-containing protein [uncultured Pseudoteredinibacter sp.]|uniref:ABC transporter six-transmembrane domain-containing protein n=1 Tax=uncultured Pseudoteredinibacter sp. TaxID=1641701 RepID=UPI0026175088|nr:ABC transporter six-transmembrane domain-containing protein [uncultured Pseudoteredinibacter sp.]
MLDDLPITISSLLKRFWKSISLTWLLTIFETVLMALIPLFTGFAIDGLLENNIEKFIHLIALMFALLFIAVCRRAYDTRVFGSIRVELGKTLVQRSQQLATSTLNARMGMGRELADFLEEQAPELMTSFIQLLVSAIVLYSFHPTLAITALSAAIIMMAIYSLFHKRFYRLNSAYNQQEEKQVDILASKKNDRIKNHLLRLRKLEVNLSDSESIVYGLIFLILLSFVCFNLWFAASNIEVTVGKIFAVISYSWSFVEAALVLPITLQSWSRLSEIMARINNIEAAKPVRRNKESDQIP